jgi:hypothetical protein
LVDAGTVSLDAPTGAKSIVINLTLTPWLYWLAFAHNAASAPSLRTIALASVPNIFVFTSALSSTGFSYVFPAFTYGVLPGTFPAVTDTDIDAGNSPAVYVRLSA